MIRTLSAEAFNLIANDPVVRPWLGGTQPIDLTNVLADPNNFGFLTDDELGGYLYHKKGLGLYMVHCLALPAGRGRDMLNARSQSLREMFTKTDCVEVITMVPDGNKGADVWAAHAGFREVFRREKAFDLMGEMVGVSYRSLSYIDWAIHDSANRREGERFHAMIHQHVADDHGEDPIHDGMVGGTIEGCLQGNAEKAIALYNRWAAHAGYEPIQVLTARPLVLNIRSCILSLDADGIQVLHVYKPREAPQIEDASGDAECLSPLSAPLPA